MEGYERIPPTIPGSTDSLMRSRRQLKRTIAERREVEAARTDADRMGNPSAIAILKSGAEHGIRLSKITSGTGARSEERRAWEEEMLRCDLPSSRFRAGFVCLALTFQSNDSCGLYEACLRPVYVSGNRRL